jgi:hypothetical protein
MLHSVDANWHNIGPGQHYSTGQYPGTYASMATSNAGHAAMYSTMPGTQWAQQPATSYAGHPSYTAASSFGGYYRFGSRSGAKLAEPLATSQPLNHDNLYLASYTGVQQGNSHISPGIRLLSPYQSPVQPDSSTFGSMSAPASRSSYCGGSDFSLTSNDQSCQMYSAPQGPQFFPFQQHALFYQSQSYGMQGVPQSSTTQQYSHTTMESPRPAAPSHSIPVQTVAHYPYHSGFS